jgi:site-specific DNA-cytosine methylase
VKVLIACEFSGIVREAFRALGHDAWSCDLIPSEHASEFHVMGDCIPLACSTNYYGGKNRWDMMIAFPPCTHLAVSGARWFPAKRANGEQQAAIKFFLALANSNIPKIAIENPIGIMSSEWRKPDQIIQPWQFGHGETKATCLWLKNLPLLKPTNIVSGREARVHRMPPGPDRWKERSRTFEGIGKAMAEQWSNL